MGAATAVARKPTEPVTAAVAVPVVASVACSPSACPNGCNASARTVQTPQRTITQALNPPQTDITTESYSIAGVDLSQPDVGLITPAQITGGTFFTGATDAHQAVLAQAYAQRKNLRCR